MKKKKNSNYIRVEREFCECEFSRLLLLIYSNFFFNLKGNVTKANKMNKKGNEKKSP